MPLFKGNMGLYGDFTRATGFLGYQMKKQPLVSEEKSDGETKIFK